MTLPHVHICSICGLELELRVKPPSPRPEARVTRRCTTVPNAARLVGIGRRQMYNWIRDRKVETVRTANGGLRVFTDSLWRNVPVAVEPESEK